MRQHAFWLTCREIHETGHIAPARSEVHCSCSIQSQLIFASSLAKLAATILCILFLWIEYMAGQSQYSRGFRRGRVSAAGDHAAIAEIPVKVALAADTAIMNLSTKYLIPTA